MNKKEALTQLEIMATNATGRLCEAKPEGERALLNKHIEALNMGINAINWRNLDNETLILPSGELLVDTKYANEAKSVRLMGREGFTRTFEEPKVGHWIIDGCIEMCDQCGEQREFPHWKYCPNCGAKMEEKGMSFIIKGIDLPKGKDEALLLLILGDGTVAEKINTNRYEEMADTEAIQIPKGARLIDANKLEIHRCDDSASRATFDYVDEWDLEDAPTILESEVMPK